MLARARASGSGSLLPQYFCFATKNEVKEFNFEDYSSLLECPICLEVPFPPVFQCETGHIICGACSKKVKYCGLCGDKITGTRDFFYENCFDRAKFSCKYKSEGCKELVPGSNLEIHQGNCDYRAILCTYDGGCGEIPYTSYLGHFGDIHNGATLAVNQVTGQVEFRIRDVSTKTKDIRLVFGENVFFFRFVARDSTIGMYIAVIGNQTIADQFGAKITLGDKYESDTTTVLDNVRLYWEGPVHTIRQSPDEILNSGRALITTQNCVKALGMKKIGKIYSWLCTCQIVDRNNTAPADADAVATCTAPAK